MKAFLLSVIGCLAFITCTAQKSDTLITYNFGDNYAKPVARVAETFKVYKKDSVWIRETFNSKRLLIKKETFSDRKLKILNGEYLEYDNGKVSSNGAYLNSQKTGLWTYFDTDGKQKESKVFEEDKLNGPNIKYWKNGNTKIIENYVKAFKVGESKIYYENGDLALKEVYDIKGKMTDSAYLDIEGKAVSRADVITEPSFPGGMKQFYMYLSRSIRYPVEARNSKTQGRVFLSFIVNRFGKIEDIKVISSPDHYLAEEAVRITSQSPDWTPGTLFGNPVSSPYNININFTLR